MGDADDLYQAGITNIYGELINDEPDSYYEDLERARKDEALLRQLETLNALLSSEMDVVIDECRIEGRSPLEIAIASGSKSFVEAVLEHGSDVNQRGELGRTPLFEARSLGVLDVLLKGGAETSVRDSQGQSPLNAIQHNCTVNWYIQPSELRSMTDALVDAGCDPVSAAELYQKSIGEFTDPELDCPF